MTSGLYRNSGLGTKKNCQICTSWLAKFCPRQPVQCTQSACFRSTAPFTRTSDPNYFHKEASECCSSITTTNVWPPLERRLLLQRNFPGPYNHLPLPLPRRALLLPLLLQAPRKNETNNEINKHNINIYII